MRRGSAAAVACAAAYLVGSVPVGLLMGRVARGLDIREHGSGGTGTTNVLRLLGPGAAALTFALDVGKGVAAVRLARALGAGRSAQALAGVAGVAGHSWPVLARFRGGKGVATGFGALIEVSPDVTLFAMAGGLSAVLTSRTVSVGSLSAVASALAGAGLRLARSHDAVPLLYVTGAGGIIVYRHAANVRRLARGEEPQVSLRTAAGS